MSNRFPHVLTAEDRRKGARTRARQAKLGRSVRVLPPNTLTPVTSFEEAAKRADDVHIWAGEGEIDYKTADVMLKALREFRFAHTQSNLERRLKAAEAHIKRLQQERDERIGELERERDTLRRRVAELERAA